MKHWFVRVTGMLWLYCALCLFCPSPSEGFRQVGANTWQKPLIPVTKNYLCPNGLRVVLSEDHTTPVIGAVIIYDVGARNEQKGKSGFAHLFEHMMFQGSENVRKTEHFKYIQSVGGLTNASTHPDFTSYFDKLPSNQIELALWLESDRMRSLAVTKENLKNQLETVKEEKRLRIDNQPYVPASIKFEEMLFDNWANGHPVIGTFSDLETSSIADIKSFFKTYYAPNNAVLAFVGDFDSEQIQKLVNKYFADIPRQPPPPKPFVDEPVQSAPKYAVVEDCQAKLPGFYMGWKTPPRRSKDYFCLVLTEKILSSGDSCRLYQQLVKGSQLAIKVSAGLDERRGPSAFEIFVVYKPGHTASYAREIIWHELEKLKNEPISRDELQKAKNRVLRSYLSSSSYQSLQRTLGRADLLAQYTLFYKDPNLIDDDLNALMNVTAGEIQQTARRIFSHEGVTVVDVEPKNNKAKSK